MLPGFLNRSSSRARRRVLGAACSLGLLALGACETPGPTTAPVIPGASRDIVPVTSTDLDTLWLGESVQLSVALANPAEHALPHAKKTGWRSSNPAVATVDDAGLVASVDTGRTFVIAEHKGRADTVTIIVRYPPEARALWVNRFEYSSAAKIAQIMEQAATANLNVVYFQVRGQGDAYYKSDLEPCAVGLCGSLGNGYPPYDPLTVAIEEAHKRGLELHAWINAFTGWASPNPYNPNYCALLRPSKAGFPNHMLIDHPDWAMKSSTNVVYTCANSQAYEYAYVSPGNPAVQAHLARVAADIVRRYPVDGIHLDRVRYPSPFLSYDDVSVSRFGRRAGSSDPAWVQWRRDAVNDAVKAVHDSITAVRSDVVLSAAVWPIYNRFKWGWPSSSGYDQYLQDPRAWAAGGYLDVSVPMTYFNINASYCSYTLNNPDWACLLDDHLGGLDAPTGRHTYIAIGANRAYSHYEAQVNHGRSKGVKGFAFYSYNEMNSRGRWTLLRDGLDGPGGAPGLFGWKASVPVQPWKHGAMMASSSAPGGMGMMRMLSTGAATEWPAADETLREFVGEPNMPPDEQP